MNTRCIRFILIERRPVPCKDLETWSKWLERAGESRVVAVSDVREFHISTVFLGLDYDFTGEGPPLLFETLVTQGEDAGGGNMYRYSTWDEAEKGHQKIVNRLKAEAN